MTADAVATLADRGHRTMCGDGHVAAAFGGAAPAEGDVGDERPDAPPLWRPFPVSELPDSFGAYVRDAARARQCDPAAVALPLLAALAGAIGTSRTLRVGADWHVPAVIWAAVVAPSGATKTPAYRAALAPLEDVERREREAWEGRHGTLRAARLRYEADLAQWKREPVGDPPEPPTPVPRCIAEDATLQAVGRLLSENPRGLLLARDELSGWVRSFDQFTGATGADLARWLEIHRAGPLRVDRAGADAIYIPRAAVSVCGTIQTAMLPRVMGEEHQAAGLLARFLLAAPPEPGRRWDAIRSARAPDVAPLVKRVAALRALDLPAAGVPPRALELSAEAADLYGEWFKGHEARRRDAEDGPWRAALAKLEEIPARLALVLALARADDPAAVAAVDADTMRRSLALSDWLRAEAARVYDVMTEPSADRADRELIEWVAVHGTVTPREVAQAHRRYRGPGGRDLAEADLLRLQAGGRLVPGERHGRPAYRVTSTDAGTTVDGDAAAPPGDGRWRERL